MRVSRSGHMRRVAAVITWGAILAGCAGLPPVHELARHDDDHAHHAGELLVLDPPPGYVAGLPEMGLSVIDVIHLDAMGSNLYHLKIDDDAHPFHARHLHGKKHPDVVVDIHHHFEQHAARKRQTGYTSRRSAHWGRAKPGCGKGIHLGIIDGGVETGHAAFKGRDITFRSFHLKGQKMGVRTHGTAVTSVLVGSSRWGGLLPGAKVSAANVFHRFGRGKQRASAVSIVRAINWMIKRRVDVINFSIGGSPNFLMKKAIATAAERGIIMVASAGNSGPFTKKKSYPAAYPETIAVAASDRNDRVARFSSAGKYVEFTAPGVGIWTAVPGGSKAMSGTSFSSPIVAGYTAALMKYRGIKKLETIRSYFRENAKARTKKKWDKFLGWGVVRIASPC